MGKINALTIIVYNRRRNSPFGPHYPGGLHEVTDCQGKEKCGIHRICPEAKPTDENITFIH